MFWQASIRAFYPLGRSRTEASPQQPEIKLPARQSRWCQIRKPSSGSVLRYSVVARFQNDTMKQIGWARKSPGGALPQAALPVLQLLVLVAALALLSAARAETIKLPLQKLSAQPTMELRCVSDAKSIDIPIPERRAVRSTSVQLRYMLSMNMVSENSQLLVLMNNLAVGPGGAKAQAPGGAP